MPYDPKKHHRRSIRLKEYDYSRPGWYYFTICTFERQFLFGEIVRNQMHPSVTGTIAEECWNEIPKHFHDTTLDVSVVMPNHLHGIIILGEYLSAVRARHGVPLRAPKPGAFGRPVSGSLGVILGQFKQAVTRRVKALESAAQPRQGAVVLARHGVPKGMPWHARTSPQPAPTHIWHKNYYEHIIRNEKELERIREYICTNPLRWRYDVENPECESEAADDIEELLSADEDEL